MKREKVVFIIGLIAIIIGSITSVFATAYLYNANEVSYDNTNSNISSTNVQNAITELYDAAQDYSSMNTRVSLLEDRWIAGGRVLAIKESTSSLRGIQFFNASNGVSSYLYYNPSDDETVIRADSSSGSSGKGTLNLKGNPVMVNGNDVSTESTTNLTLTTGTGTAKIYCYGSTCTAVFQKLNLGSITSRTTFTTIPSGYRPPAEVYCLYDSSYNAKFAIASTGGIWAEPALANKDLYVTCTYVRWN